jgi:hypothetical protein
MLGETLGDRDALGDLLGAVLLLGPSLLITSSVGISEVKPKPPGPKLGEPLGGIDEVSFEIERCDGTIVGNLFPSLKGLLLGGVEGTIDFRDVGVSTTIACSVGL